MKYRPRGYFYILVLIVSMLSISTAEAATNLDDTKNRGIPERVSILEQEFLSQSSEITSLKQIITQLQQTINNQASLIQDLKTKIDSIGQIPASSNQYILNGVVNDVYGSPVRGASIRLIDQGGYYPALTDVNGHYQISVHETGTYLLVAEQGYLVSINPNVSIKNSPTTINLTMNQGGTIVGNVMNITDLHAFVELYDQNTNLINKIFVNPNGQYQLNAPQGTYILKLIQNGQEQSKVVTVTSGQTITSDF